MCLDASVYYVTYSIVDWLPVFVSEEACRIVANSLNYCHDQKELRINAYVIMPSHLHTIVFDREYNVHRLEQTMTEFRKFTGRQLSDFSATHMPRCFVETMRRSAGDDRERRYWQSSRHPEALESERFWRQKFDYLHDNPRRKGLVVRAEHWRYSSAAYYESDGRLQTDVKLTSIDWI
jgi:putative transposase